MNLLLNYAKLLFHHLKLLILLPVLSVIITALVLFIMPPVYHATATLTTSGDTAYAAGVGQNEAVIHSVDGIQVTVEPAAKTTKFITINSKGSDYQNCITAVNSTANAVKEQILSINYQVQIDIDEATSATKESSQLMKKAVMAFFVGLLIAVLTILIIDRIKRPIKSLNDVLHRVDLPVLGVLPSDDGGERLLANVRFSSSDPLSTVVVVPLGKVGGSSVCMTLKNALSAVGVAARHVKMQPHAREFATYKKPGVITLVECQSLEFGISGAYAAREADLTIVVVCEWEDTVKDLLGTIAELNRADADLSGLVYLSSRKLKQQ